MDGMINVKRKQRTCVDCEQILISYCSKLRLSETFMNVAHEYLLPEVIFQSNVFEYVESITHIVRIPLGDK